MNFFSPTGGRGLLTFDRNHRHGLSLWRSLLSSRLILAGAIAALFCLTAWAQSVATLTGTVLDPSGAAVPKATVTATGTGGVVKVAETNGNGQFSIAGLPAGQYTIRVIATGFQLLEKTAVDIPGGRPTTFDAKLAVEASKQEVTVADTQNIDLDPAKNAGALVLKSQDLDMLPDDPDDLQADLLALAGPAVGPNGGQMYIDGFSNGQLPPKESIREIRINSNPFSTEYDQPGFGRIEIFTKPGSDKYRGFLQFNYGDSVWNARNPYSTNKPYYNTQNLNANLSGPLGKKASFFVDFSRRDMKDSSLINAQIVNPTTFAISSLQESLIQPNVRYNVSPRVDYQLTQNITLSARYSWVNSNLGNQGVGGFNLASTAYTSSSTNQTVQLTETQVVNANTINETHFQYFRQTSNQTGLFPVLNISVNDAFTTGSNFPLQYANTSNYELQNYTSISKAKHYLKFGARIRGVDDSSYATSDFTGQYTFTSIQAYQIALQNPGIPFAQLQALGGAPSLFTLAAGNPLAQANMEDIGLFIQDDWKVLPNLTISPGLRYEWQTNISDKSDFAPRVGIAWGIGGGQGRLRQPKTVIRAGFGYFYNRFPVGDTLATIRDNGINQVSYQVTNPSFYPIVPPVSVVQASGTNSQNTIDKVAADLHVPMIQQVALSLERQLPKSVTLSVNFITSRGTHQLQTVDINTPLPGTWTPGALNPAVNAVYPLGTPEILNLYESGGIFKQNQVIFNVRAPLSARVTLFGFYAYGHVDASSASPSDPYNFALDYGRASYDIHHRINVNGSILLPFNIRLSPNISYNSAPPFNITEGVDDLGNSLYNQRPAFLPSGFTAPACTQQIATQGTTCIQTVPKYGSFVINPAPGMKIIPVNYGTAWGQFNVNLRVTKIWGFGEPAGSNNNQGQGGGRGPGFGAPAGGPPRGGGGGGGGGPRGGGGGPPGGGGFGGGDASGKRFTVSAGAYVRNIFNTVNQGSPEGDLLQDRFGQSLALGGGGFGGGTQSANRRMELFLNFRF